MSEAFSETIESNDDVLEPVLTRLQELHAQSTNGKTDTQRILDGMNSLFIGKTTLRAQSALIQLETQLLQVQAKEEEWSEETLKGNIEAMTRKIIADMVQEHLYESTLSTPENPNDVPRGKPARYLRGYYVNRACCSGSSRCSCL